MILYIKYVNYFNFQNLFLNSKFITWTKYSKIKIIINLIYYLLNMKKNKLLINWFFIPTNFF